MSDQNYGTSAKKLPLSEEIEAMVAFPQGAVGLDFVGVFGASYVGANRSGFFFRERGFVATAVPEPGSIALLIGMVVPGAAFVMQRRKVRTA